MRVDWLEAKHTLHRGVEILYVVDGYEVQLTDDDEPVGSPYRGETLRDAIDAAMEGEDRVAYQAYVANCHSRPGEFVSEFRFDEWIANGKPKGTRP
jgi:hypothetical protein